LSIHVALNHITHYRYDRLVNLSPQIVRLRPAPHSRTRILSYSLTVEPAQHFINWQQDPFANHLARLVFPKQTREFKVTVDLVAEMAVFNPFDFFLEPQAEHIPFAYTAEESQDLLPYLAKGPLTPRLKAFVDSVPREKTTTINFLVALNQRVQRDISYLVRMEPGVQTPEFTLTQGSGSCRDSGWLLVQVLRHLGLAARFVSGYLIQLKPDVKSLDGPSGAELDFTDLHAWCEVYLPGAGWVGLDPTSGLLAGEGHIPVACTPEPSTAAPVSGAVDACEVTFEHHMKVTRIVETPRVTLPYSDAQWQAIQAVGAQVDAQLQADDVRLTMGGEPTFVSIDNRDGAEWNTDALGPTKRGLATALVHRLRERYGKGGFVHFGQGKWYPGEQLPRWALTIAWRTDGLPCWQDASLFADERECHAYTAADAERFAHSLTQHLGLDSAFVQPAYEDAWAHLVRERRLPVNVDPYDAKLDDELERARLRRVFTQGLGAPVGYVLPITRAPQTPAGSGPSVAWKTGPWHWRDERLLLVPGDSPMGFRLPLDSLPWTAPEDRPLVTVPDPFSPAVPLPEASTRRLQPAGSFMTSPHLPARTLGGSAAALKLAAKPPERHRSAQDLVRTALCVEVRDPARMSGVQKVQGDGGITQEQAQGALYVFMPPLAQLEDYLALLAAVEATAAELGFKIALEGYGPPRDARLKTLAVTPDPGVIEVNIHPSSSWAELVDHTEALYDLAHHTRLTAEKFMIDGRHTGTGGGNHFVLGGATPADSPFLRRPDVLSSLLAYWHNHPSLSYLFSGLFIGPTSQAPRFDEARNDQVYEVEIALAEIERQQQLYGSAPMPPWLIDRALRNLLVDVTGNTHRSEFCIDKLYSPDGPAGRLGLLELRAFEMPPHARMSLAQQLLLRSLLAWFWRTPYRGYGATRLTRWGTALHDRFMLPTFVQLDFEDVMADLRSAGFAFDSAWFAPHLDFRFPLVGEVVVAGVQLTLRHALEPWHVMGEEGGGGGTVRYVDSSLERLELKASGLNVNRHGVTVNGRALPLAPTGRGEESVCGVRFKAWAPASALHPTLGVHAPLTFDLVDTWHQRSLGGCRYHVAHPGGRNHDTLPVNAFEAEARRLARFERIGHTPGHMAGVVPGVMPGSIAGQAPVASNEFPFTIDLRRL
jgi:uncharacterized protein (DUF2126 family)